MAAAYNVHISDLVVRALLLLILAVVVPRMSTGAVAAQEDGNNRPPEDDVVQEHVVVRSIQEDLPWDTNGRLDRQLLLYPQSCSGGPPPPELYDDETNELMFVEARAVVVGDAINTFFPDYQPPPEQQQQQQPKEDKQWRCPAVCLGQGVTQELLVGSQSVLPHHRYEPSKDEDDDESSFEDWLHDNCLSMEVCVINYHSYETPIEIYWISEVGYEDEYDNEHDNKDGSYEYEHHEESMHRKTKQFHSTVDYGSYAAECFYSFLGHSFQVQDGETEDVLRKFTVNFDTSIVIGELNEEIPNDDEFNFDDEITHTLQVEWTNHKKITRTFSPLGFDKGQLPNDVFASMGAFYYNNRNDVAREEWVGMGFYVNWWESDCAFVRIPPDLSDLWAKRLKVLVEAWAGIELEQTSLYGMRQYQENARLITHVDRESTHAVSLIVNIAQGNIEQDWPVEVHDHMDRLHEVTMQPGEVVFYESAKCLHGRNRPLQGKHAYYVNLFTHYRPVGESDNWYTNPNHEGTPEPLLDDVRGECRNATKNNTEKDEDGTQQQASLLLPLVGTVECDDKRLGDYVSPTLFSATSGEDLIDWWRRTAPPEQHGRAGTSSSTTREEL